MATNPSVQAKTASKNPPQNGWAPHNTRQRLLSQLDASTGQLTGSQQQWYAGLPNEDTGVVPGGPHRVVVNSDGSVEYRQMVPGDANTWKDPAGNNTYRDIGGVFPA